MLRYVLLFIICRSISLLMQISIPCLCFADKASVVIYKGGTNVDMAPPVDFYIQVRFI